MECDRPSESTPLSAPGLVISWGEVLWDLFPDGPVLGGCAANVAFHAAQLGARVLLVSRVGDDELGHRAIVALRGVGVDTSAVQVDGTSATGTVFVRVTNGHPRYTIAQRAAWDRIECTPSVGDAIGSAAAFCYGTLVQRSILGGRSLDRALQRCPPGCTKICDLNIRQPHAERSVVQRAIAAADVVKLNEAEARWIASAFDVSDAVDWILQRHAVRLVALTRGAAGSLLATRAARLEHPGCPSRPGGDAVGAGDAFVAVLATLGTATGNLEALNEAANRYAAVVASHRGATPRIANARQILGTHPAR